MDANSRRFRNHRLQWVVRAASPPPTFSTYCFTGAMRLRIDIESAVRAVSPVRPPTVALEEFQTQTFAQQTLRPTPSGRRPAPSLMLRWPGGPQGSPKRQRLTQGPSTPRRNTGTGLLTSPPRRTAAPPSSSSNLEQRLQRTEQQLESMQRMLAQILTHLGGPMTAHISSEPPDEDDSMDSPRRNDIFEPSDVTFSNLADDARAS